MLNPSAKFPLDLSLYCFIGRFYSSLPTCQDTFASSNCFKSISFFLSPSNQVVVLSSDRNLLGGSLRLTYSLIGSKPEGNFCTDLELGRFKVIG
jgi:hypothetical protein